MKTGKKKETEAVEFPLPDVHHETAGLFVFLFVSTNKAWLCEIQVHSEMQG